MRNTKNYIAYNYTGITILNKNLIKKYSKVLKIFLISRRLFQKIIKKNSSFIKLKGFFHSMDNFKDIDMVNKTSLFPKRYK